MATLNLTATDSRQQTVLDHLIPIVSDTLAEKINNGVYIEKDGKRLLNKKDLSTFMTYATEQARKIYNEQKSGSQAVCVLGDDIMSWAIHYFEEESIEGKLYNPDGTEYKPPKPVAKTKPVTPVKVEPPKPKQQQASLWDMLEQTDKKTVAEQADESEEVTDQADDHEPVDNAATTVPHEDSPTIEEIADKLQRALDEKNGVNPRRKKNCLYSTSNTSI